MYAVGMQQTKELAEQYRKTSINNAQLIFLKKCISAENDRDPLVTGIYVCYKGGVRDVVQEQTLYLLYSDTLYASK